MARLSNTELAQIKDQVSLLNLVNAEGHVLHKQGKDYAMQCPFHDENTPSLMISPDKNLFNCFGCGAAGTVIDWVMKTQSLNFRQAVDQLRQNHSALAADQPKQPNQKQPGPQKWPDKKTESLPLNQADQALLNQVIDFYHQTLLQSPDALAYLDKRGLADMDLITRFKLGYANRTLAYRLPEKQRKAGKLLRTQLQGIGLLRESGHEHFNGSLVIPVLDKQYNVVECYGRKIRDNLRKGTPKHLYLPGPHAGVWNASGLVNQSEVILCEALIDALTFYQAGYTNVTTSYGTGGFTEVHLAFFKTQEIKRVLIAYDRDEAGNNAAKALAEKLSNDGIDCYRLHFPKGMDANAYALEVKPARKSLGVVIRSAEFIGEGEVPKPSALVAEEKAAKAKTPETENTSTLAPEEKTKPPLAAAVPPEPINTPDADISDHEIKLSFGQRHYRVRGLAKNTSYDVLKVNVLVSLNEAVHVDTFDLYSARHRQAFVRVAAVECAVDEKIIQRDLGQLLLQLEGLQDQAIQAALAPNEPTAYTMDETERAQALDLLNDKHLVERLVDDFTKTGLVGEPNNALMGYLACVSRKLNNPLAIIVQSTSAAGKSALMEAVLKLIPEEDRVHYSAMTGQSLFYLGETNLKHKILGIAEEEGIRQAAYALKLLQSQGELTIASTGKDPQTGKLVTEAYRVEGPVMLFLTTTAIDIDEELLNRCVVLTINESREQTAAIQQRQRQARTLSGLLASNDSEQIIKQHQNAQRLLRPLAVVNPYAEQLAFADSRTRTRRDHEKYLTLIDSIALLHQYQRDIKSINNNGQSIEYIEVTLADITLANQLAHDILGRSLDELPPPTRQLLKHLYALVADKMKDEGLRQSEVRFTRKAIRASSGLSNSQVSVHLTRLVELEYVYAHHGGNGQRYVYELVFDGEPDKTQAQLIGLIDVKKLTPKNNSTTSKLPASGHDLPPGLRPASGVLTDSFPEGENRPQAKGDKGLTTAEAANPEKGHNHLKKNEVLNHRHTIDPLAATGIQ